MDTAAERLAHVVLLLLDCVRQGAEPAAALHHFGDNLDSLAVDVKKRRDDATGAQSGVLPAYFRDGKIKLVDYMGPQLHIAEKPKLTLFEKRSPIAAKPDNAVKVFKEQSSYAVDSHTSWTVRFYAEQGRYPRWE